MCGIIGYVGNTQEKTAIPESSGSAIVLQGLKRLEYRGYDSAGIATLVDGGLKCIKKVGKVDTLVSAVNKDSINSSGATIGHTRWATHGAPSDINSHPHLADRGRLALVHNGIIENIVQIKEKLLVEGEQPLSDTDSELVALLLAQIYRESKNMVEALQEVSQMLSGSFALLVIHVDHPDTIFASRKNSPLIVGLGENENFVSSDVSGFIDKTKKVIEIQQDQIAVVTLDNVQITDFFGNEAFGKSYTVEWDIAAANKDGFDSFMMKEIHEQPDAIMNTLIGNLDSDNKFKFEYLSIDPGDLKQVEQIVIVACGTAAYSGQISGYAFEKLVDIPVRTVLAHEFRYSEPALSVRTLVIVISQSGETMDTLMALRYAKSKNVTVLAICNTLGAAIPSEADSTIYTYAGPEIAVASTKAFLSQIVAMQLFVLYLAELRGQKTGIQVREIVSEMLALPQKIGRTILDNGSIVAAKVREMDKTDSVIFLGKHVGYPTALEGALKLKELAYIHAEGFAAGELKHGPIALISDGQPVFTILPTSFSDNIIYDKMLSSIITIRSRGAQVFAIASGDDPNIKKYAANIFPIPNTLPLLEPVLAIVPLQIFACEMAAKLGLNIDQPRNLAKSVTVE